MKFNINRTILAVASSRETKGQRAFMKRLKEIRNKQKNEIKNYS